jgi:sulfur-oxidizing protein SoxX
VKLRVVLLAAVAAMAAMASGATLAASVDVTDTLDQSLAAAGDVQRGRGVFVAREGGHCVICHTVAGIAPAGNVGPPLDGVGLRLTAGQIRLRIVDITRVKVDAVMPAFFRSEGLARVAPEYSGKTLLGAQQVEDLVAFLGSLK